VPTEITSVWGGKKVELRETQRAGTPFGGRVVFFEVLRQVGYAEAVKQSLPFRLTSPNALDPAQTFTAFWLAVLQALDAIGRKGVIGAYGVGQPEPDQWATMIPALQYAAAHGHIVALHVYCQAGTPVGQLSADQPDYEGRVKRLYAAVPADARPTCIISECAHEFATGKFEGVAETVHFAGQMQSFYQDAPYIQGINLFTFGAIGGWAASSIDSATTALATAINSQRFP